MFERRGLPKTETTPIIYLSGYGLNKSGTTVREQEIEWIKRTKCKYRCYSFAFACPGAFYYSRPVKESYDASLQQGVRIMMDSGAFSFHGFLKNMTGKVSKKKKRQWNEEEVTKLREETIEKYVSWCKEHSKEWDFYCNFDYRPHAPLVWKVQQRLEKLGMRITPVFHGDQGIDWLENYFKDGHKLVAVGTTAMQGRGTYRKKRIFYDMVFDKAEKYGAKMHGLAVTALGLMFQYPWASVDSASWVKVAAIGRIMYMDEMRGVIGQLHISTTSAKKGISYNQMVPTTQKEIRRQVEKNGWDFQELRENARERGAYNAFLFNNKVHELKETIERTATRWETLI